MSSNKYWEMWMDRKKNLTKSGRERSYENLDKSPRLPPSIDHKTSNSFLSERPSYLNLLDGKEEIMAKDLKNNSYLGYSNSNHSHLKENKENYHNKEGRHSNNSSDRVD